MPQPSNNYEREDLINRGLYLLLDNYEPCEPKDADTALTPTGIINIFSNAFDQEQVQLSKSEVNELLEDQGFKSRLIGQTLYWQLKKKKQALKPIV